MTASPTPFTCRTLHSITEISATEWDALAGNGYPFLRHAFLLALEQSGCATAQTGWEGTHLLFSREDESAPCAALPLYLKTHSMGEYVFDWSWADAYRRHGLDYYPKLISAAPFTPCAGPRLLTQDSALATALLPTVAAELKALARRTGASSWHVLFPEEAMSEALAEQGTLQRMGCQFQWFNRGYTSFEHYLQSFNSRKRKNLRKEREKVQAAGIRFEHVEGAAIDTALWRRFYRFYASTYHVRGREPYLNLAFFEQLGQSMPEQLLLVVALQEEEPIAGALFFKGSDTLYGRYWGCSTDAQFLHFETCYYQGIDYCIEHGLARIDSGAQGEHKIQRGFEPVPTWSNHWIARPDFRRAIAAFVQEEQQHVRGYLHHAADYLPFRKDLDMKEIQQ
ncbi:MAG TPA: GNAT family N-acetyltransferase [Hyphomicrobiales bacterium]|nr:GNAT family N-acetyltransferase [Hyphomicrobiales bacterium]